MVTFVRGAKFITDLNLSYNCYLWKLLTGKLNQDWLSICIDVVPSDTYCHVLTMMRVHLIPGGSARRIADKLENTKITISLKVPLGEFYSIGTLKLRVN